MVLAYLTAVVDDLTSSKEKSRSPNSFRWSSDVLHLLSRIPQMIMEATMVNQETEGKK